MAMKQPILASIHFNFFSNDQDKPSPRILGENTDTGLQTIPDACGPKKNVMLHFNEATD